MPANNNDTNGTDPTENSRARSTDDDEGGGTLLTVSRRTALGGLLGLSLLSGSAAAQPAKEWKRDRDAQGHKLFNLDELEMIGDPVIASTDGTPLDLRLNGERVLRLGPTPARSAANLLGGHPSNAVGPGVEGATVSGGGFAESGGASRPNEVLGDFGTVGGGQDNTVSSNHATIAGGRGHTASDEFTTIAGGIDNEASGSGGTVGGGQSNGAESSYTAIGGGSNNRAYDDYGTIGGGQYNRAGSNDATSNATYATVPGGRNNTASGAYSLAAGRRAKATHDGSFVWADSTDANFASTAADQFLVRASGGVGVGTDSPAGQLAVAGTVTATDYAYDVVQTGTLHVPIHVFDLDSTTDDEEWTVTSSGYGYISGGSTDNRVDLHSPVDLPDGATVRKLTGLAYSNTSAGDINLSLSLKRLNTSSVSPEVTTMAQVSMNSPTPADAYARASDLTISSPTIVNDSYAYYLEGYFEATAIDRNLRFYGCKIDYEYISPGV